jgi:hypothetical protein
VGGRQAEEGDLISGLQSREVRDRDKGRRRG